MDFKTIVIDLPITVSCAMGPSDVSFVYVK